VLPESSASTLHPLNGRRVLAVDNSETNRRVIKSQLDQYQVDIACVASADEAWRALMGAREAGQPFEVALIDTHLPDCDGADFGKRIAQDTTLSATKLILLTRTASGTEHQFIRQGFTAFLSKPVSQRHLTDCLYATLFGIDTIRPGLRRPSAPQAGARHRILLAEDNIVNEKVARRTLEKLGYRVAVARNGKEAVEAWASLGFDLILMDCQMPVLDGYEATREIRRREPAGQHIPIIALTAHAMKDHELECKAAGMDDCITKPLDRERLKYCLTQHLRGVLSQPRATDACAARGAIGVTDPI
jgi:two-component system sensor histidine kinase/response regulator